MGPPAPEAAASAPGKVILLGEHAVVYGQPSLSLALDRRIRVRARAGGPVHTVNGQPLDAYRHAYVHQALDRLWTGPPLRLGTRSRIPSASGIGSSAALSVATVACLLRLRDDAPPEPAEVARQAFETERATQGAASPNDTTVATAGGAVLLAPRRRDDDAFLWRIQRDGRAWNAHRVDAPPVPLVVAASGTRSRTADMVAKVARLVDRDPDARDAVAEIGRLTLDAATALQKGDLAHLGALMNRNHECLRTLGVDTPRLAKLVDVARRVRGTHGAKLTGAGGGGSIVVLTEDPARVERALAPLAAKVFPATAAAPGLEVTP